MPMTASATSTPSLSSPPTHLVLIPSYNPGPKVYETVRSARAQWTPVWVVVDGSTDDSAAGLQAMAAQESSEAEPNTVLTVCQKGYLLHERLIRPAMVIIAKAAENNAGQA